jgi:hypothetical protein
MPALACTHRTSVTSCWPGLRPHLVVAAAGGHTARSPSSGHHQPPGSDSCSPWIQPFCLHCHPDRTAAAGMCACGLAAWLAGLCSALLPVWLVVQCAAGCQWYKGCDVGGGAYGANFQIATSVSRPFCSAAGVECLRARLAWSTAASGGRRRGSAACQWRRGEAGRRPAGGRGSSPGCSSAGRSGSAARSSRARTTAACSGHC